MARLGRPGQSMGGRDLAAVGKTGLQARRHAPIQHLDIVASLPQVPRGGSADHAGTEDDDLHLKGRSSHHG